MPAGVAGGTPVPPNARLSGLPPALSVTLSAAFRVPVAVGVNVVVPLLDDGLPMDVPPVPPWLVVLLMMTGPLLPDFVSNRSAVPRDDLPTVSSCCRLTARLRKRFDASIRLCVA